MQFRYQGLPEKTPERSSESRFWVDFCHSGQARPTAFQAPDQVIFLRETVEEKPQFSAFWNSLGQTLYFKKSNV
jgi:hypothetical protein